MKVGKKAASIQVYCERVRILTDLWFVHVSSFSSSFFLGGGGGGRREDGGYIL